MTDNSNRIHLWLRDETKPHERRTALTPNHAKVLVDAGFKVTVEHSTLRCFADSDYIAIGADMQPAGSWNDAPRETIIEQVKPLLPAILQSISELAPSGEMFADGIRLEGLRLLAKHHVEEGISACVKYAREQNQ